MKKTSKMGTCKLTKHTWRWTYSALRYFFKFLSPTDRNCIAAEYLERSPARVPDVCD